MSKKTALLLVGVALVALGACSKTPTADTGAAASSAKPAPSAERVRGTLSAVSPTALTVQTYGGQTVSVPLDEKTGVAWVVDSSLSTLKDGDFVGTATTGPSDALRAVELVIFPESMRGTGEGHYAWDVPGAIAAKGGDASGSSAMTNGAVQHQSAMTNGTVQQQSAMTNGTVQGQSAMTNGAVANQTGTAGETKLTITYKGGTSQVLVPQGTPIVRFEPTQASVLKPGQKVFVVTTPGAKGAKFVAVGKNGVTPPM